MQTHVHLINDQKICDTRVKILIELPMKPCVNDLIVLTEEQAIELSNLARENGYLDYECLKGGKTLKRLATVGTVLFKVEDQSIHLEVIPRGN